MSHSVTWNTDSNYQPMEGRKKGCLKIRSRNWLGNIFPISHDQSSRNKNWVKNTLVTSYSRALIALKMCWEVTFDHRFDNNFWTVRNFRTRLECFRKYTFRAWFWTQIFIFFIELKRVSDFWTCPTELPEIRIPIISRPRDVKKEV